MSRRGPRPVSAITGLEPYRSPKPRAPVDLLLSGNEGATPDASILEALDAEALRRYPSAAALEAQIAARFGVAPERVLVTAGVDDALDRACRAFLERGRAALYAEPTFEMIERYVRLSGAEARRVAWPGGPFPLEAMLAALDEVTTLVFVVSPNNPHGGAAPLVAFERLADAAPGALLVADLAYVDFATEDPTAALVERGDVLVLRTLSKAWGVAGLRVGYAIGPPEVLDAMRAVGQPYAVAGPSAAGASAWLARGDERVRAFVDEVRRERGELAALLESLGARAEASEANFVLGRFADARFVQEGLAGLGIAVRGWPGRAGLDDALRITCPGDPGDFERLRAALETLLAPEALLFDLDGVLADVSASYRRAIVETAARFGVEVGPKDVAAIKAEGDANNDWVVTQRLLARSGVERPLDEVTRVFEELYQGSEERPGLRATERALASAGELRELAAGLPIAIVTGRPRRDAERFLDEHGLAEAVDVLVAMEDAPAKPDPAPVRLALERLGVRRAWMVGDTPDDARAARAAGVLPIGILAPGDAREAMEDALAAAGAARVIEHVREMREWRR